MLLLIRDTNKLMFIQLQHVTSTDATALTTVLRCAMFLIEFHFVDWMQQKPSMSLVLTILLLKNFRPFIEEFEIGAVQCDGLILGKRNSFWPILVGNTLAGKQLPSLTNDLLSVVL